MVPAGAVIRGGQLCLDVCRLWTVIHHCHRQEANVGDGCSHFRRLCPRWWWRPQTSIRPGCGLHHCCCCGGLCGAVPVRPKPSLSDLVWNKRVRGLKIQGREETQRAFGVRSVERVKRLCARDGEKEREEMKDKNDEEGKKGKRRRKTKEETERNQVPDDRREQVTRSTKQKQRS